jgi:tetratricopeptide (TPR) repeat protein
VPVAIRRCEHIREQVRSSRVADALTLHPLALLRAMTGDFDEAWRLIDEGNELLGQLRRMESEVSHHEALVDLLAGRPEAAEARLRPGYERLGQMGAEELRATTATILARAVRAQHRQQEAEDLVRLSERITPPEDIATQVMWRGVLAGILAGRGELEEAARLAKEAVRLADATDLLTLRADALMDLEEVARVAGRLDEARAAALGAVELYELKADLVSLASARARLAALLPGQSVATARRS